MDEAVKGLNKDRLEIRVGFANVSKLMSRVAPGFILKILSKPVDQMLAQMKPQLPPGGSARGRERDARDRSGV